MRRMNRAELYDNLCDQVDEIAARHNMCGDCPINDTCKSLLTVKSKTSCCKDCRHLGPNGCTVRALGCKLFICGSDPTHTEALRKELKEVREIAQEHGLLMARASKEETLKYGETQTFWALYPNSEAREK